MAVVHLAHESPTCCVQEGEPDPRRAPTEPIPEQGPPKAPVVEPAPLPPKNPRPVPKPQGPPKQGPPKRGPRTDKPEPGRE